MFTENAPTSKRHLKKNLLKIITFILGGIFLMICDQPAEMTFLKYYDKELRP